MNVNGVGGTTQPQQIDQSAFQTRFQAAMSPVASLFGESSDQLMQQLQTGNTSLSDLAKSKGISQDQLTAAIKQGLQSTAANGAPALSDTQLTNIANRIAGHKHGGHHHHHAQATDPTTDPLTNPTSSASNGSTNIATSLAF